MSHNVRKLRFWFSIRSNTIRAAQPLEQFSDLVIVLAMWRKQRQQGDQCLCFRTCKRFACFSQDVACMS